MKRPRKILSTIIKLLIGLGCLGIIYLRLKDDLTSDRIDMIAASATSGQGLMLMLMAVVLIPFNWGLEARKWQLITAPVEKISYRTATMSVYSGVCLGNLAPGRATEFAAKILFFHMANRPKVTVLHVLGGMFQLSITIIAGFAALLFHAGGLGGETGWLLSVTAITGVVLIAGLVLALSKTDYLLNMLSRRFSRDADGPHFHYAFTARLLAALFSLSFLRYLVFYLQFVLILLALSAADISGPVLSGIALFFLVTTAIPMISMLEAPIRAAIALVVFRDTGVSDAALALAPVLIWLINIMLPSIAGYCILLRQNFNFKLFRRARWSSRS